METNYFKWNNELTHAMVKLYADASVADVRAFNHNSTSQELSYRELLYVYTIATTENCTAKDLVALFGVSKSMVSQMVSRLEEKKLVTRIMDEKDNRVYHISLSQESVVEFSKKIQFVDLAVQRLKTKFTDQELDSAARVMKELSSMMSNIGYEMRNSNEQPKA